MTDPDSPEAKRPHVTDKPSDSSKGRTKPRGESESLRGTLSKSEQVQDQVEEAADELDAVNKALRKRRTKSGVAVAAQATAILSKVDQAAEDLESVNEALAEEIDARHDLERELKETEIALSKSRSNEQASQHHALHDELTGLPNASLFADRLQIALALAERHATRVAVMFIDLDKFKEVNDIHGHEMGDEVLRGVARRLGHLVRASDSIGRRSGDEFLFLMGEAQDESRAVALATKMVEKLAAPLQYGGVMLCVDASIGIALYPEDATSGQDLLRFADKAMYEAKRLKTGTQLYSQLPPS